MNNRIQLLLAIMVLVSCSLYGDRVKVRAVGQSPAELPNAREAAVEAALRQAVEAGAGIDLASITEVRDYQLIADVIYTKTAGIVDSYSVLEENPNQGGLYTVRVEAVVSRGSEIDMKLEAWKALIKRKGRPRVMVVGSVDRRPFDRRLTGRVQGILERRGLGVIDLDLLEENKRLDAERAARGDLDPMKAALISREVGADYLVVVQIEGTEYPAEQYYGATVYPVDATAIMKVLTADTARVIASEVMDVSEKGDTAERALRAATDEATGAALKTALERIAAHWLEDVDQRGGMEITVVANSFGFERFEALVKGLRAAGGVKDIIVDHTDYQGRSSFRVVTNTQTFNVASVLKAVDPGIRIDNSSKYRVEISPGAASGGGNLNISRKMLIGIVIGLVGIVIFIIALRNVIGK